MAESSQTNSGEEKEEPVNLLYLATQHGLDHKEVKLHENSSSRSDSLEASPSHTLESSPATSFSTTAEVPTAQQGTLETTPPQAAAAAATVPQEATKRPQEFFRSRQLSTHAVEEKDIHLTCPRVNCPEKIVRL